MQKCLLAFLFFIGIAATCSLASAQNASGVRVVQTCGASPAIYMNLLGQHTTPTQDIFGNACSAGPSSAAVSATAAAGGVSAPYRLPSSAATTNATLIKSSAGRVYKIRAYNTTGSPIRLKLFNKATAPTVGTDTPFDAFLLTPGNNSFDLGDIGWSLSAGIGFALTANAPDTDATAIAAGAVTDLSIGYQ